MQVITPPPSAFLLEQPGQQASGAAQLLHAPQVRLAGAGALLAERSALDAVPVARHRMWDEQHRLLRLALHVEAELDGKGAQLAQLSGRWCTWA